MTNHQFCETTSRVIPLHDQSESWKKHFASADLVIEAVFEEIGVKHRYFLSPLHIYMFSSHLFYKNIFRNISPLFSFWFYIVSIQLK